MKKISLILAALATGYVAQAQDAAKTSYSVTVDFPYTSKYVFRGIEFAKDSFQPSVEIASGNFYGGLWTNQPIVNNVDNEIDFYAGYNIPLNSNWKVDVGATVYYYPEADKTSLEQGTYEGYVGLTGSVAGFTPALYAYYDFKLESFTTQASVGYSIPLESAGTSLDLSATYGLVQGTTYGIKGGSDDSYAYWGVGANVPYKLTEKATATVGVQYVSNKNATIAGVDAENDRVYFTAGLTVGF